MKFVDLEEIYCGWWCMIRLLMIGLIIIVFIWILNNFYYKNKTPLLRKINPVLRVLFFLLLLLVAFKLFPKLGLNPLLVLQKLSTLLGIIWFDWVVRWKWLISSSWNDGYKGGGFELRIFDPDKFIDFIYGFHMIVVEIESIKYFLNYGK